MQESDAESWVALGLSESSDDGATLITHVDYEMTRKYCCCCCSLLFTQLLRTRKYFCHTPHSSLCSSYWHFHTLTERFSAAWGILFLFLTRLLLTRAVITWNGNLFDVQINDVLSVITNRVGAAKDRHEVEILRRKIDTRLHGTLKTLAATRKFRYLLLKFQRYQCPVISSYFYESTWRQYLR